MRLIVAGSRDFNDYILLEENLDYYLQNTEKPITIISGGARGADKLGEKFAIERGYELEVFEADWDKFGKKAGMFRNRQMAEVATHLICFWDGTSKGTKGMIDIAKEKGIPTRVVGYASI